MISTDPSISPKSFTTTTITNTLAIASHGVTILPLARAETDIYDTEITLKAH